MTRIVAGVAGGRRLAVPARGTRPTAERVREALFGALDAARPLEGMRALDLYAGSGALGLEALSRGAQHVLLVESDRRAVETLRRNVSTVGIPGASVRAGRVERVLRGSPADAYDLVLADPPYAVTGRELGEIMAALVGNGWLVPNALVVVERAAGADDMRWPPPLCPLRQRRYGDTVLCWAEYRADADGEP